MKKVFSWIFAILSLILLVVFVVFLIMFLLGVDTSFNEYYMTIFMDAIVCAIIAGAAGHFLAKEKGFPYYVTFPTYGVVFVILWLCSAIKFLFYKLIGHASDFPSPKKEERPAYIVVENGLKRRLELFEANRTDYEAPLNAGYGRKYNLFKDDTGRFWRSYDGNKTFYRE